jgi:hypothetical protein
MKAVVGSTAALLALLAALLAAATVCEAFVPQQRMQMMATGVKRNPNFGKLVGGCV